MKNKCSSEIPNMPTECAPDNRRPEKICGTCRYFNPEFPVNGKPAPVCFGNKENERGNGIHQPPVERNIIFVAQMGDTKTV